MYDSKKSVIDLFTEKNNRAGFTAQEIILRVLKSQGAIYKEIRNLEKSDTIARHKDNFGIIVYIKNKCEVKEK
jgi:CTP-dependent riboflavin kinase|tara:strand:+ start:573 stop:791 length:219 start_codon:yes stop_codon:yes gene_type:complete